MTKPQYRLQSQIIREMGVSESTFSRWVKKGFFKTVRISTKNYVDMASFTAWESKVAAGKYAKDPAGCAAPKRKAKP